VQHKSFDVQAWLRPAVYLDDQTLAVGHPDLVYVADAAAAERVNARGAPADCCFYLGRYRRACYQIRIT
jgi:hypothetical protein